MTTEAKIESNAKLRHRQHMIRSQLLLRRLRAYHYEYAPESMKNRFLPSPIIGCPLRVAIDLKATQPFDPLEGIVETSAFQSDPVGTILIATATYYRVPLAHLVGERGSPQLVRMRQVAMYLARRMTWLGSNRIGRAMNRDHATIIHGERVISKKKLTDTRLARDVSAITERVKFVDQIPSKGLIRSMHTDRSRVGSWDSDRIATLVRLREQGKSFEEISEAIGGGITRYACIAKYKRHVAAQKEMNDVNQAMSHPSGIAAHQTVGAIPQGSASASAY